MSSNSDTMSQSEIDQLLSSLTAGLDNKPETGQVEQQHEKYNSPSSAFMEEMDLDEDKKGYKLYNFRRPDKFSKDHLRALQDIHREFSRQLGLILTTYLRMHFDIDVVSVDQLTYDEFSRSMPTPVTIGVVDLSPLPGEILMGMSHEITSSIVDRMLGGTGISEVKPRELTDIEEALAKRVLEKITRTLEETWKSIFPVEGKVIGIDNNYSLIQIASPGEIVALVTLEIQIAGRYSGLFSLCFPYPVLEGVLSQLSAQHFFQSKGIMTSPEDKQKILDKLNNTFVDLEVTLGSVHINVQDLVDLKVGDVLKLDNNVNQDLVVKINNIPKFLCKPGTKKNKVAISITEVLDIKD